MCIPDIDRTGVAARYQSQTFKVARYCASKRVGEKEVGDKGGPPGLGLCCDLYRTSASDPACEPRSLGGAPGITGELVAPQHEAV